MGDPATNACSCSKDGDEADEECSATCSALARDLAHRYSFDGTGTTVDDTVGVAHGVVVNGALAGAGALTLTGGQSDQYVDLPNGIVSDFTNATLEVWVTWSGGEPWQRIFDFGTTNLGIEGTREVGRTYLMLTPYSLDSSSVRLTYQLEALTSQVVIDGSGPLPAGTMVHLVAVVDDDNDTMALYQDGRRLGCATFSGHLSSIDDVNSWFGRSQWATDPSLGGVFHEVRIYRAAITDLAVRTSFAAGPDPSFLQAVPQGARQTPK
jgi:hypothetical protein